MYMIGVGTGLAGPVLAGPLLRFNDIHLLASRRERSNEPIFNNTYRNCFAQVPIVQANIRSWIAHAHSQCILK